MWSNPSAVMLVLICVAVAFGTIVWIDRVLTSRVGTKVQLDPGFADGADALHRAERASSALRRAGAPPSNA